MSEAVKTTNLEENELEDLEEVIVLDDASAEMLLQRIKEAEEQYERMEAWYTLQMSRAKQLRDRTVAWAEGSLRAYFDLVPTKNTKTQRTYELPGGKMVLKHQAPSFDQNDEKLVPWLKANRPELVKVKESSNWAELKKELTISSDGTSVVTADGEIVPGVTVTQREDKFTVTVK